MTAHDGCLGSSIRYKKGPCGPFFASLNENNFYRNGLAKKLINIITSA
jgi:hypothetical protein